MADYGTILDSNVQIFEPAVQGKLASPVATFIENMSSNLQTFVATDKENREKRRQKAAADRQAKEDAYKDMGRNAEAEAMFASYLISQGSYPGMQPSTVATEDMGNFNRPGVSVPVVDAFTDEEYAAIQGDVDKTGRTLMRYKSAVTQGTLPGISADAALDKSIQDLVNKHGVGAMPFIIEGFKKIGVEGGILNELKRDISSQQADEKAVDDERTKAYGEGANTLTSEELKTMSYDQVVDLGRRVIIADNKLEQMSKQATLQGQLISNNKTQLEMDKETASREVFNATIDVVTEKLAPRINSIMAIAREIPPGTDPKLDKRLLDSVALLKEQMNVVVEDALLRSARAGGYEVTDDLRKTLTSYIENTFIKPIEERGSRYTPALKAMSEALQLDTMKVAPFLTALESAGVKLDAVPAFADLINKDQNLQKRLAREVMGLSKYEIGSNTAKMELNEIISLINGNKSLEDYTPTEASKYLKQTWQLTNNFGKEIRNGNLANADEFMNGLSVFINATNSLVPTGNEAVLIHNNAANALAGGWGRDGSNTLVAINNLLKNDATSPEARVLGQASRAAGAKILTNMRRITPTYKEGYYSVRITKDGFFETVFDERAWRAANTASRSASNFSMASELPGSSANLVNLRKPQPSDLMNKFVSNANHLVMFMTATTAWDDSAPKGNSRDLNAFYGAGRMTPEMRKEVEANKKEQGEKKSAARRLTESLDAFDKEVRKGGFELSFDVAPEGVSISPDGTKAVVKGVSGQNVALHGASAAATVFGENLYYKQAVETAERTNMPKGIFLSLIQLESQFNSKARSGVGASGLGQIVPKVWDSTAKKRYGKTVTELTPAQNLDLAAWILADNYKKSGSWEDALAMYHSGGTLAKKGNADDGNMKTRDYVALIMQASRL